MRTIQCLKMIGAALAILLMAPTGLQADPPVQVAAEVSRPSNNRAPVTVMVTNAAGDTLWTRTSQARRFAIRLPDNEQCTIRFEQPASTPKVVVVDTRHAARPSSKGRARKIAFEVVMQLDPDQVVRYAGPVGRIGYRKGGGSIRVEHDYTML